MAKSEIRLHYSGFIVFVIRMLSVATGLAFTLMLTRAVTKDQLGVWSNINDIVAYFAILAPAIPFWAMRFAARNQEGTVKTGVFANLMISVIATLVYLPLIPMITSAMSISGYITLYLIASMQIIENYLLVTVESCLRAKAPQTVGYGLLIEECCKVLLAYVLMVKLEQGLTGALFSILVAIGIQIIFYFKLLSQDFKQSLQWNYVKEWLKGSTLNIYYYVGDRIAAFALIMLMAYDPVAGPAARGIYQAAWIIASIITYSSYLSFALYPKILAENSVQDVKLSLKIVLMFAIPMTAGAIALSGSYLIILDPEGRTYVEAIPVLRVLAINAFVQIISQFFSYVLWGLEKIDEKAKIPLQNLVKSRLFKAFTLPYVHSAITLPTTYFALTMFAKNQPLTAATYVGIIDTIARSAMFLVLYAIIRRTVKLDIPWKSIVKYIFASTIMATFLFLIPQQEKLSFTLGLTATGGIVYFTLLMAIDKEARTLFSAIWAEIKSRVKRLSRIIFP